MNMARTMEKKRKVVEADRCELCGAVVGDARERARHLRSAHPQYARNVFARVAAPAVFLVGVGILSVLHAPPISYLVALAASYGVLFFGRVGSRKARAQAGARASIGVVRTLREGGVWFVLVIPVVALVVFLLSKLG
jgi:hypothetical protein